MMKRSCFMLGIAAALVLRAPLARAAETAAPRESDTLLVTLAGLNERIEALQKRSDLDEVVKARLLEVYNQTAAFVKERNRKTKEAEELGEFVRVSGPQRLEKLGKENAGIKPFDSLAVAAEAEKMSLPELQKRVHEEAATLNELAAKIDNNARELVSTRERRDDVSSRISQAEAKLSKISREAPDIEPGTQPPGLEEALRLKWTAEREMINAELTALRQEGLGIPLKLNVLSAEEELLSRRKKNAEKRLVAWREALAQSREAHAMKRVDEASAVLKRAEAEEWPAFLIRMARKDVTGYRALSAVNKNANSVESTISQRKEKLARVKADYERTVKRVKSMGFTPTAGVFFQRSLRSLRRMRAPTGAAAKRRREIKRVTEEQLMLEELREEISRLDDEAIQARIAAMNLPPDRQKELESQAEKLFAQTKELLGELDAAYPHYLSLLADEGYAERALRLEVNSYSAFLTVQLFWTKSNQAFNIADLALARKALSRLFLPGNWYASFGDTLALLKRSPASSALWLVLLIACLAAYPRLGRRLNELNGRAGMPGDDSIMLTVRALGIAAIRAGGVPLLIYLAANQLWAVPGAQAFTRGVCAALAVSAKIIFLAWLTIEIFGPRGVGQAHFRWPETLCREVGHCARQVLVLAVPLIFFMTITNTGLSAAERGSLGRVIFMVTAIVFARILSSPFRRGSPVLSLPAFCTRDGFWAKTRRAWLPLSVVAPLLLLVFTALGYYYNCIVIGGGLLRTIVLVLALVFVGAFLHRWRWIAGQRREAEKERTGQDPAVPADRGAAGTGPGGPAQILPEQKDQLPVLIRLVIILLALAGLYRIWGQNIPALQILNDVILWTLQVGRDASQQPLLESVTLGDLLRCIFIFWLTVVVVKNIVGWLDLIVFRRLKVDSGNRYAIGMLSRYVIAAIGITLAFDAIGIGWGKVQWLIAALTVGLGFGLQEIVANFVSGLIILFEKPIRIGDIVTVGNTIGRVTKIQIRATTITDFNRQQTIIPNKIFITDKIVNWSLSDRIIRITLEIGIAYGSDVAKAQQLLLKVAGENKLVIDNPRPSVVFNNFGDSSLNLELRIFVHIRNRTRAKNQLNLAINEVFKEGGIEIPFPQRDIHIIK